MSRPSLRRSTRTQSKAKEPKDNDIKIIDPTPCRVNNTRQVPEGRTEAISVAKQRGTVTNKEDITNDVVCVDDEPEQSDDSFQSTLVSDRDIYLCSQETSAEVLWDCSSPDMRKYHRSKKKRGQKSNVGDIVQTLSTSKCDNDLEDDTKPGLLGLWMDSDMPDNSKPVINLSTFSPTSSFPPPRTHKEKRKPTVSLSSVLKEKLSMRMKEEKSLLSAKYTRSSEKRKRDSESMNISDAGESPSKVSRTAPSGPSNKDCDQTDVWENSSETSWSEDDFYGDESFIIKATQVPNELSKETKVTKNTDLNTKLRTKTPAKYSNQKCAASHSTESAFVTKTVKQNIKPCQRQQSAKKETKTSIRELKRDKFPDSERKKSSKRNSLGFNSSLSDDILCQVAEVDCILDSQVQSEREDENKDLKIPKSNLISKTGEKSNTASNTPDENDVKGVKVRSVSSTSGGYSFVQKGKTLSNHTAFNNKTQMSVSKMELQRNPQDAVAVKLNSSEATIGKIPDENAELFNSDEEDLLSEPQVLALLDAVESQAPKANCSLSNSQPNMIQESSTQSISPCKRKNGSDMFHVVTPEKSTPEEIQYKRNAAIARRLSNSQPNSSSWTVSSPEKRFSQELSPHKCTPEEIQQKKNAAIAKRLSSSQQSESKNLQTKDGVTNLCLSPNKDRMAEVPSLTSTPRKCSPEEIQKKKNEALAKRQKKCSGNKSNNVSVPVLSNFQDICKKDPVGQPTSLSETPVCSGFKKEAPDRNVPTDSQLSSSVQKDIEKKRLEALKRRELKLKTSQICKSST
ncbi:muscle M-line assembly protein unc-89-like [Saccostrea echinata]|uniref:muscle M-line assembly protein unc-89-like n=1 Tax=Saccostrea echinata TaxID=191078 RepID=UPI002A8402AC|nr:muscle M-line assembly protein unc-89-like [Saccostrea echinata]